MTLSVLRLIAQPATLITRILGNERSLCYEPNKIVLNLPGFVSKPLAENQSLSLHIHLSGIETTDMAVM